MKDLPSDSDNQGSGIDSSVVSRHSRVVDVVTQCHQSRLESCAEEERLLQRIATRGGTVCLKLFKKLAQEICLHFTNFTIQPCSHSIHSILIV